VIRPQALLPCALKPMPKSHPFAVSWNAHSLTRDRLSALHLFAASSHPCVFFLCETKLDPMCSPPTVRGYSFYSKPLSRLSGGTALLVASSVSNSPVVSRRRQDLELSDHVLVAEAKFPFLNTPILLVSLYHHRCVNSISNPCWSSLKASLSACHATGLPMLAVGDYNARHRSWDSFCSDAFGVDLVDFCPSIESVVLNSMFCPGFPTFPQAGSVIDLVVTSDPSIISNVSPASEFPLLSDHYPLRIDFVTSDCPTDSPRTTHTRQDFDRADWQYFSSFLANISSRVKTDVNFALRGHHSSPAEACASANSILCTALLDAAILSIPTKIVGPYRKHWWNAVPGVPDALMRLRRAHRRKTRCKSAASRAEWLSARSEWSRITQLAKGKSWENLCHKIESPESRRLIWPRFHATSASPSASVACIAEADQPLPRSITESLNRLASHYSAISAPPSSLSIDNECILRYVHLHQPMAVDRLPLDADFSISELKAVCDRLRKSASGPDSLSPLLLRHCPDSFRAIILTVLNFSWTHGVLPSSWLQANVVPIHKGKGAPLNQAKSFRPISLTCALVKVLERMIANRLVPFLEKRHYFNRFQAGFRASHCTADQLFRAFSRIQSALRSHSTVAIAFLDIVAAFDKVWHDGLLYKLFRAGVQGRMWRWIKAFLSNRSIRVSSSNCFSNWYPVNAGVPQGSVLGPLLFLIYLNDLPIIGAVAIALFADDIALWPLYNGKRGVTALNAALAAIHRWSLEWHVLFSLLKSFYLLFTRKRKVVLPQVYLGSDPLPRSFSFPYLGITLVPSLKWHSHCNRVISDAFNAAYKVSRIITPSGPSPTVIRQLVLTIVLPIITYGWPFWCPPSKHHWDKLECAVCLPLRCCLGLPPNTHRLALFVEFGIPSLRLLFREMQLAAACRFSRLPQLHASADLFNDQYRFFLQPAKARPSTKSRSSVKKGSLRGTPRSLWPFGCEVKKLECDWDVQHSDSTVINGTLRRRCTLTRQIDILHKSNFSRVLRQLEPSPCPTAYILHDSRAIAVLRARIRLNRNRLNHSLFRRNLADSAACPVCPGVSETGRHVLFDCPAFDSARHLCFNALDGSGCPISFAVLTGDVSSVRASDRPYALRVTADYMTSINAIRPL